MSWHAFSKFHVSRKQGILFVGKCLKYLSLVFIDIKLIEMNTVEETPLFINFHLGNSLPTYLLLRFCIISMYKQIALRNNGGE